MNDTSSMLVAHCGARKVTREELMEIPVPDGTRTHQPLSHYEIVEVLEESLSFRQERQRIRPVSLSDTGTKVILPELRRFRNAIRADEFSFRREQEFPLTLRA